MYERNDLTFKIDTFDGKKLFDAFILSNSSVLIPFKKIFFLLGLTFGLSACSLDASIESLSQDISNIFSKAVPAEVVPASSQGVYSTKGYEVQASVSYYNAKPEVVTSKGYTVQTNLQSTLFKE